ncbi:MAG TPA: hypothetical protein PLY94_07150 [Gemmatimonadaceae bacterium]|nr:hypothetical protein [Gemmatimonadaceae bacterium]
MKLTLAQRFNPAAWLILPLMRAWTRRTNPTRDFPAARTTHAIVSVDAAAAGSLHPEMPLRALETLGPADWHSGPASFKRLYYYALGTMLQLAEDRVGTIEVLVDPSRHPFGVAHEFAPGVLELQRGGRRAARFDANTTESQLTAALGAADYTDRFDDRRVLGFTLGAIALEAELDAKSRRLIACTITTRDTE